MQALGGIQTEAFSSGKRKQKHELEFGPCEERQDQKQLAGDLSGSVDPKLSSVAESKWWVPTPLSPEVTSGLQSGLDQVSQLQAEMLP